MLTLMSVANPWMRGSPDPLMSHSVDGFPGLQFSATTLLAGLAQAALGVARCARLGIAPSTTTAVSVLHRNVTARMPISHFGRIIGACTKARKHAIGWSAVGDSVSQRFQVVVEGGQRYKNLYTDA